MNSTLQLFLPLLLVGIMFSGCSREGCRDRSAQNYDSRARKDATCSYTASRTFWWDDLTQDKLRDRGALTMRFFLDGELMHSEDTNGFWDSPSFCHEEGSVTVTKSWTGTNTSTGDYVVKDQRDSIWWSGTLTFQPNVCEATKLTR